MPCLHKALFVGSNFCGQLSQIRVLRIMKNNFYFILLFVGHISYGQISKNIEIPMYQSSNNKSDTSLWFKDYFKLGQDLKLPNLQVTNDSFYFRFWTHYQVIDIWTFDKIKVFGKVTNFAERYDSKLLKKGQFIVDKVFFKSKLMDSSYAKNIYNLITKLNLTVIPSDEKINGWGQGFDGSEYLVETSIKNTYSFKTYWTPSAFADTIIEAKRIQSFIDYLFKDLKLYEFGENPKCSKGTYKTYGIPGMQIEMKTQQTIGARNITDLL